MRRAAILALCLCCAAAAASADVPLDTIGRSESLPTPPRPHWVWASDIMLRRSSLLDLDSGAFLGMVSTGLFSQASVFPRSRPEFYLPETYYSRGTRGERSDVVTIYDARTLAPVEEIAIPPKRAINVLPSANFALTDDERFLAIFNMTPGTSLSIVDLQQRRFVGEIATPGCSLVFAAGERRLLSLCGNGSVLTVTLDGEGRETSKQRSEPFFDPERDPVTEKAVRYGDTWLFVSFAGVVHPVVVGGEAPVFGETWKLVEAAEGAEAWRIGGIQNFAVHQGLGRLYSIMHQGEPDTPKEPGTELWVYDLATRERIQRIELRSPGFSLMSENIEFGRDWIWPFDGLFDWMLDNVIPNPGLYQVQVTQDDAPLLVTGSQIGGSIAVYDARSLEFLRRIPSGNLTTQALQAPWGASGATP